MYNEGSAGPLDMASRWRLPARCEAEVQHPMPRLWSNEEHRHSAIRFVTPAQRHANLDQDILLRREALYEAARQRNPLRWKGPTRNGQRVDTVHLNPDRIDNPGVTPQRRNQERKAA